MYNIISLVLGRWIDESDNLLPTIIIANQKSLEPQNIPSKRQINREKYNDIKRILRAMAVMNEKENAMNKNLYNQDSTNSENNKNETEMASLIPLLDLFTNKFSNSKADPETNEVIHQNNKKTNDKKETKPFVKQSTIDKIVLNKKEEPSQPDQTKIQSFMSDIKKEVQNKKSQVVLKNIIYLFGLVIVGMVGYYIGKKSESENYLRVLSPDK